MNMKTAHQFIYPLGFKYYVHAKKQFRTDKNLSIMMYHSISHDRDQFSITPESFEYQMNFIKNNYSIIRLNQAKYFFEDTSERERKVVITFDDAYCDFLEFAYPVISKLSIPCTIFVPVGFIGKFNQWDLHSGSYPKRDIMTLEQLLSLHQVGLTDFGSHSVDHVSMNHLSPHDARKQAVQSKAILDEMLGCDINTFAYPYGQREDFSDATGRILSEAGYEVAVTALWGTQNSAKQLFKLRRICLQEDDTHEDIRAKIEGHYDWLALKAHVGFALRSMMAK